MDPKIKRRIERAVEKDHDSMDANGRYDNMHACKWNLPLNMGQDWVRKRVSTTAKDIIKQACNIFDTHHPKIELLPFGPNDADNAERMERWAEWHLAKSNARGGKQWSRESLRQSTMYDKIALQVDYISKAEGINDCPFCVYPHHPSNVHYEMSGYGLLWVAVVQIMRADDLLDHWMPYSYGDDDASKKVKRAMEKLEEILKDDGEATVIHIDYTDKEKRYASFYESDGETIPAKLVVQEEQTVLVDDKNELGFVNWVIVSGSSGSVLESLDTSGAWENQNFLDTLMDSTVIRRAYFPLLKHTSQTGRKLSLDLTGPDVVVEDARGDETEVLMPPPIDPAIRELVDRNNARMAASTGIQQISAIEAANVQYATISAIVALKMTELEPYKRNAEMAVALVVAMFFRLTAHHKETVVGYRTKAKGANVKGEKINVGAEEFDPEAIHVTCTLLPNTQHDQAQRVNAFAQLKQLGFHIPDDEFVERLDFGSPDVLSKRFEEQEIANTVLEAFKAKLMGQVELELQMAAAQIQAQAQPQQPQPGQEAPQQGMPQPAFEATEGMNAATGPSPYTANPSQTQTVMRGMNGKS